MADLKIIAKAKPSPISQYLSGNDVFDHRVTGHFGPFQIAHLRFFMQNESFVPGAL